MAETAAALLEFPLESRVPETVRPWRLAARLAFRFWSVYFGLYILCTQMFRGLIPFNFNMPNIGAVGPVRWMVEWTAVNVFGVTTPLVFTGSGSGDKTTDWVLAFCLLVISTAITLVWSIAARRPVSYDNAHKWFRLFLRFSLGSTMLGYGVAKLIPLQMPFPSLTRLLEPYGHFSPMGVLWASIGASRSYEIFTGALEMAAAVLLFIPQTALLGAVLATACMAEIFTLNMTYDVPVKLFSFHLVLMSLFLLAPDAKRLVNVLVLNRPADVSPVPPLGSTPRRLRVGIALQLVFGLLLVAQGLNNSVSAWRNFGGGSPRSPLFGIWNVAYMSIDGVERAPLVTDYDRWRRLTFDVPARMAFHRMDDTFVQFNSKIDEGARSIVLTRAGNNNWRSTLTYDRPSPERLLLQGEMDGKKIQLRLELFPRENFLLVTRGFNWVQEFPFNR